MFNRFWTWYEHHRVIITGITAALFLLQIVHLTWLATDVILPTIFDREPIVHSRFFLLILTLVDYTEIPALISASLLYLAELRKGASAKSILYLLLINSQWLHLFWITDEYVLEQFFGAARETVLPLWLAITAVAIDYLEVPVMIDTVRQFSASLRELFVKK